MRYKFEDIAINITQKREPLPEDRYKYVGLEHMESGSLFINNYGLDVDLKGAKLVMHEGDILIGKRNAYLRRAAIAPHDGLFSAHGLILRPKEDVIDKKFFPFFVSSDKFFDEMIRISVGGLSPTVNWKNLKELEFTIPPIEEQRKLADKLWAAYRLKEAYKELLAATDEMVKAQFVEMFGEAPKIELGKICKIEKGATITRNEVTPGDIPVIAGGQEPSCFHNVSNRSANVITVSASGAYSGFVNFWNQPIFASDCNTVLPINTEETNVYFVYKGLKAMQTEIYDLQKGGAQPHVYGKDLEKFLFPKVMIEEQNKFATIATQADESKRELQKSIAAIDQVIKSLINN